MTDFNWYSALAGGALLGLSAATLLWLNGRTEGVSGLYGGLLTSRERDFRLAFVIGLIGAGLAGRWLMPQAFGAPVQGSIALLALAGFLVGFGTRMGSGCTSGHGICGLSRFSPRSLVATLTFVAAGAATVLAQRAFSGGT